MPSYDFKCETCGATFEATLPMGSTYQDGCPQCQSRQVRKLFTTAGVLGASAGKGSPPPPSSCPPGGCGGGMCGLG